MEAMLGISLYSYLYLKLAKNAMSFLLSPMFSFNKIGEEGAQKCGGWWWEEWVGGPNNVYMCK
jgi:hypothetical protein